MTYRDEERDGHRDDSSLGGTGAREPDRARVRRVGCRLGLLVLLIVAAVFAWGLYNVLTAR